MCIRDSHVSPEPRFCGENGSHDTMSNQRKRHTSEQIVRKLGQADRLLGEGNTIANACRELGVTEQTLSLIHI